MASSLENQLKIKRPPKTNTTAKQQAKNSPNRWHTVPYSFARSRRFRPRLCPTQRNRCHLNPVAKRKRDAHQVHPHLVRRIGHRAHPGHNHRIRKETNPHENLLSQSAGADIGQSFQAFFIKTESSGIPDIQVTVGMAEPMQYSSGSPRRNRSRWPMRPPLLPTPENQSSRR